MSENPSTHHGDHLANMLGISRGLNVAVVNAPQGWADLLEPLPKGTRLFERASEPLHVIVYFSDERPNIERRVPVLAQFLADEGSLWCVVPEAGPLNVEIVRELALRIGLVVRESMAMAPGWVGTRLVRKFSSQQ
jgi:hypothetical protein